MRHRWLLVIVFLVGWGLLTRNLTTPWFGYHDANGVWVSAGVLNWHRYGFDTLRGMVVINYAPATPEQYAYYPNHPPLAVWSVGLTSVFVGTQSTELIGRWTMACFTLISGAGLYIFTRRLFNSNIALMTIALYVLTPMIAYYGRMPNHEAPSLAIILLFSAISANWLSHPTWVSAFWMGLLAIGAVFTAWSAMLIVGCLGLAMLIIMPNHRGKLMLVAGMGVLGIIGLLVYYEWGKAGSIRAIIGLFSARTDATSSYQKGYTFTAGEFIIKQVAELLLFATPIICSLGLMGMWRFFRSKPNQANDSRIITDYKPAKWLIGALLLGGLGYILILRDPAFSHDFLKIFLIPPLVILTSLELYRMPKKRAVFMVSGLIVWGFLWLFILHQLASFQTLPYQLGKTIASYTTPETLITTDIQNLAVGVDFYANRHIQRGIKWQDTPTDTIYVTCSQTNPPPKWERLVVVSNSSPSCSLWRYSG